ncbi:MAG: chromosome partitioning protein [Actinomycetota bacterium]|nr:chromosome partitioning protein [Actinomycetota bacterium]
MTTVALFNNKGEVGKTTLAFHLAHMMSRLGIGVLAVDLDPQANLTAHFLDEQILEDLWAQGEGHEPATVSDAVAPIVEGLGDIASLSPRPVAENLWLLPGDLGLGLFEERLAQEWPGTLAGNNKAAFRATTALHRVVTAARQQVNCEVVLIDVGPNLGALNRSALLTADHVVVPLGADLFSVQGLRNLGPTLRRWRSEWQGTALPRAPQGIESPTASMNPLGYVVMQPSMRLDRPVRAYQLWLTRIPGVYSDAVLDQDSDTRDMSHEIGTVRNFRSLMPLSHDARKPMFDLRAADGAIGSTQRYVQVCFSEFRTLARDLLGRLGIEPPD